MAACAVKRAVAAATLCAAAVTAQSASPSPYLYSPSWAASIPSGQRSVVAGTDATGQSLNVCRAQLPSGEFVAGKRTNTAFWCNVAINGTDRLLNPQTMLVADNQQVWGTSIPSGAVAISAGTFNGQANRVCRAMHPTLNNGPHSGYVASSGSAVVCVFPYNGVGLTNSVFQYLYAAPTGLSLPAGAVPVLASPSATPTRSAAATPSPSTIPYGNPLWMTLPAASAVGYTYANFVRAGSESTPASTTNGIYVCRAILPSGDMVTGKWGRSGDFCDVPADTSELASATYEVLIGSAFLAWSSYPLPDASTFPHIAGAYQGFPVMPCRAYHPTMRTGPHSGYTTYMGTALPTDGTPATCVFSYGGGVITVTNDFQVLTVLSTDLTALGTDATGAWAGSSALPFPSSSSTPTPTPTPSPSIAPPVPGRIQWWSLTTQGMPAGTENGQTIFVCRGFISGSPYGEVIPGKFLTSFNNFCDVPWHNLELVDRSFEMLRFNPLLAWNSTVPAGATPVVAGTNYEGLPLTVCRALHPTVRSGPHAGYTDGQMYNGQPLCFFSYGGSIIRTAPFDYLFMLPVPSASPTPTTPTPTPSAASATSTPSASRSPVAASVSSTPSALAPSASSSTAPAPVAASASPSPALASVTSTPSAARPSASPSAPAPSASATASATPSSSTYPIDTGAGTGDNNNGDGSNDGAAPASPSPAAAAAEAVDHGTTATAWLSAVVILLTGGAVFYYFRLKKKEEQKALEEKKTKQNSSGSTATTAAVPGLDSAAVITGGAAGTDAWAATGSVAGPVASTGTGNAGFDVEASASDWDTAGSSFSYVAGRPGGATTGLGGAGGAHI